MHDKQLFILLKAVTVMLGLLALLSNVTEAGLLRLLWPESRDVTVSYMWFAHNIEPLAVPLDSLATPRFPFISIYIPCLISL